MPAGKKSSRPVAERVEGRYDEVAVYSYDSMDDKGLVDFLPNSATKQTALEYVAEEYGCEKRRSRILR